MMEKSISTYKKKMLGALNFFKRSIIFDVGFSIIVLFVILSLMEPVINNYILKGQGVLKSGIFDKYLPPSFEHPLGTDHYGRDVLALLLASLKNSLLIGAISGGIATLIGIIISMTAGYIGGKVDDILSGVTNTMLVIPSLPILIAVAAYTRLNLILMCIVLAIFSWPASARTIRAQILSLKERPYIELAKVTGFNSFEIMFKEILPNIAPFIGMGLTNAIIGAIFAETGIRLLGLGPGEIPSLGLMINWALAFGALSLGHYHILLSPAITLILLFTSLSLINIGLEEIFNPRLKKITGI
ncbi:MAG: ABC transporter permease [Candidatus Bathyarchaeia archaeon]